jgi:hypothetical protein
MNRPSDESILAKKRPCDESTHDGSTHDESNRDESTSRPEHSLLRSYIKRRFFVVAALLIKAKKQHGKNQNKNTGLFINCMDFVVVHTKINKK